MNVLKVSFIIHIEQFDFTVQHFEHSGYCALQIINISIGKDHKQISFKSSNPGKHWKILSQCHTTQCRCQRDVPQCCQPSRNSREFHGFYSLCFLNSRLPGRSQNLTEFHEIFENKKDYFR